jgi:4-hydroxy-tetrahydrodipicolinate synthase
LPVRPGVGVIRVAVLGEVRLNREGLAALLAQDKRLRIAASSPTAGQLPDRGASVDVLVVGAGHDGASALEHVVAGADAGQVGLILYNTFWTSLGMSAPLVEKLATIPNVVGLKWATPDTGSMAFEQVVSRFADRFSIIDNQMRYVISHMLGARSIEIHVANYWPEWAVRMWDLLEAGEYVEAQRQLVKVAMPFMALWTEMESFTSGDGYLDKLCMELVGLPSSRSRPPTRDVRPRYRDRARDMLIATGVPRVVGAEERAPAEVAVP